MSFYRNNLSFFIICFLYLILQIILAIIQYLIYIDVNPAVKVARIGGILLDLNSSLIVLLALRRLTTWIRNSVVGRNYLPMDDVIKFHKFIGIFIVVLSLVHTIGHCVNLCKIILLDSIYI